MTAVDTPARRSQPAPQPPGARASTSAVLQLARAEARRLARHPLVWGGVLIGALLLVPAISDIRLVLPVQSVLLQVPALPIAAMTLVAAHLATTRPRRDDVVELLAPASHGEDTRTLAVLAAVLAPTIITAGLVAITLVGMAAAGGVGEVLWAEAAIAPALVAGGGVLGVLLGRVVPWKVAPLFAIVVLAVVMLLLDSIGGPTGGSALELLGPVVMPGSVPHDPTAMLRPAGLHLLYVLGGVAAIAAAAALVSALTARRLVALVVALLVTATAGGLQLRVPDDAAVEELLVRVVDPAAAGTCTSHEADTTVCLHPEVDGWRTGVLAVAQGVRVPLLARGVSLAPLTIAQQSHPADALSELARWFDRQGPDLERAFADGWDIHYAPPPDTVLVTSVWPGGSAEADPGLLQLALHTARQATGLPAMFPIVVRDPSGDFESVEPCTPVGQAREPITLWLAAQADPAAAGALRHAASAHPYPASAADVGTNAAPGVVPGTVDLFTPAVGGSEPEWSQLGVHVALQMLDLPTEAVLAGLTADWARWTAPATSLRDLVAELGLSMPPLAADLQGADAPVDAAHLERLFRDTPAPTPTLDDEGTVPVELDADGGLISVVDGQPVPNGCP